MSFAAALLIGFAIDAMVGWPDRLYARIGHPVTWIGALITACETAWNAGGRMRRIWLGASCVVVVVGVTGLVAFAMQTAMPDTWLGTVLLGIWAAPLIATRSMYQHVAAVATPLLQGDLGGARQAVSMIVGRDPQQLDAPGISRAALESLAENSSDGIVAPVFWGVIAGLPGIAMYKAINTLDSMIGHRSDRYDAFGKVAARLDDLVNLVPARLTALLFALATPTRLARTFGVILSDARHHRSPNAGWPEAAMAGALQVRLSGPRAYGVAVLNEPWVNGTAPDPTAKDLRRGLNLYLRAMGLMALALGALALI